MLGGRAQDFVHDAIHTAKARGAALRLTMEPTVGVNAAKGTGKRTKTTGKSNGCGLLVPISVVGDIPTERSIPLGQRFHVRLTPSLNGIAGLATDEASMWPFGMS